ncbi:MAG: tetratricopeptide repeat protein, partial [Lachnospiraceae bacterium]|nr:tetratricopeptide repeat protein [Lachnospiraceae bacterium]
VMDYIEGDSLQNLMRSGRVFSVEEAVKYTTQLLEALVYLHGQAIPVIHGDIKPSNIMLTPGGDICLIDFNISGYLSDNRAVVTGYTAGYASPEQERAIQAAMRSGRSVRPDMIDGRTDLYSTGAVMYALLTGRKPARNLDEIQLRLEHMKVSDGLIHVLYRALQPEPSARYATAAEMLGELRNYRKLESGYKKKVMRRRIAVGVASAVIIAGILAGTELLQSRRTGKEKEYQGLLTSLGALADEAEKTAAGAGSDADAAGDSLNEKYAEAQDLYTRCSAMYPERCAPVVEMARFLYEAGEYDECRRFIRENVVMERADAADESEQKDYGKLFYLLGNCYYQAEDMDEAAQAFSLAIEKDNTNPDYYRDYALALAKSGDRTGAEQVLRTAEENGLAGSQTAMVRGEILLAGGRYEEAIEAFAECIQTTDSDTDRLRAYLNSAHACEQMGNGEENLRREADILEEAKAAVLAENQGPILETLAQTCIRLYDLTADSSCAQQGVETFREIIRNGWSTAMTYNNIIVLLQRTGDLAGARQYADEMLSRYPDDYRTYKRLAFVENAEQESRAQEDRDYSTFAEYYQTAESMYGTQKSGTGTDDAEMRILEDAYGQLSAKGWL